jgi:hypothetical protein
METHGAARRLAGTGVMLRDTASLSKRRGVWSAV